ncbi:MAG: putative toxin-antitoxin system toxin component, PIN family [Acidimicrobiales bacterium]|nr:putative toxin-antitoxin system toxin component, PIN family [Acidimicrobiales bacterium]
MVLDANVFVSGAIQKGASFRIVQRWLADDDFEVILCPELIAEVADVLTERPRLRKWIDLPTAHEYIETISALVDLVSDPGSIEATTRDPDDDYLVALAREHSADYIVTGDKDLLEWEAQAPPAITPVAFEGLLSA